VARRPAQRLGRRDTAGAAEGLVTKIVLMGMGEPLYNFEGGARCALIVAPTIEGIGISRRR